MKKLWYAEPLEPVKPIGKDVLVSDGFTVLVTDDPSKYKGLHFMPVVEEALEAYKDELAPLLEG